MHATASSHPPAFSDALSLLQAGVWRDGKLEAEMEEWQCALAVEGAGEAATAASRVQVRGGCAPAVLG